ncbi:MAG: glycoside hydrolase family 3 protein [Leptospiraceae bacterium]|nr:glycoside hydrolase family 3 protein [Leptospiraceae bacterium]
MRATRALWTTGACVLLLASIWPLRVWYQQRELADLQRSLPIALTARMSLDELIGQLFHIGIAGQKITKAEKEMLSRLRPGGIILFKRNLSTDREQITALTRGLQQQDQQGLLRIPRLISIDQEGGRVQRIHPPLATDFPAALSIGWSGNAEFARLSALVTGFEMRALGIQLVLAPVLDINNNPRNPVINTRSFGSDAATVAEFGDAYTAGALEMRSGPVIKHFPGHGNTDIDSHLNLPRISLAASDLEQNELLPFKSSIAAGAPMVMVAHISFPALDTKYPASLSPIVLQRTLRQTIGFQGLIMTDALEMKAIADRFTEQKTAQLAISAGADILLFAELSPRKLLAIQSFLRQQYIKGQLDLAALRAAVRRQLAYKLKAGLWHDPALLGQSATDWQDPPLAASLQRLVELDPFDPQAVLTKALAEQGMKRSSLVRRMCAASIRSLGSDFEPVKPQTVQFYYTTLVGKAVGVLAGLPAEQINASGWPGAFKAIRGRVTRSPTAPDGNNSSVMMIEFGPTEISRWNQLVQQFDQQDNKSAAPRLVGLYTGNPWLPIALPAQGAVLLNTSDLRECRTMLMRRALQDGEQPLIRRSPPGLRAGEPREDSSAQRVK